MDIPRPMKMVLYGFILVILVFGLATKLSWFNLLFVSFLLHGVYRFISMSCHHKYTALPMITVLLIIAIFNIINLQTISLLGIAMALDILI